jgi:threonine dehydrogenase-like Zn-dependent dehydrogenase
LARGASSPCPATLTARRWPRSIPHGVELPIGELFPRNKGVRGGFAPARSYIPELLPDVLDGRIDPGRVLDYATDLEGIADAYAAMDERRAIKPLVRVGVV